MCFACVYGCMCVCVRECVRACACARAAAGDTRKVTGFRSARARHTPTPTRHPATSHLRPLYRRDHPPFPPCPPPRRRCGPTARSPLLLHLAGGPPFPNPIRPELLWLLNQNAMLPKPWLPPLALSAVMHGLLAVLQRLRYLVKVWLVNCALATVLTAARSALAPGTCGSRACANDGRLGTATAAGTFHHRSRHPVFRPQPPIAPRPAPARVLGCAAVRCLAVVRRAHGGAALINIHH